MAKKRKVVKKKNVRQAEPKGMVEVTVKGPIGVVESLLKGIGNIFGVKAKVKKKKR